MDTVRRSERSVRFKEWHALECNVQLWIWHTRPPPPLRTSLISFPDSIPDIVEEEIENRFHTIKCCIQLLS